MKPFCRLLTLTLAALLCATALRAQDIPWDDVQKTGSSLADLETKSATDLTSGTLAIAQGGTGAGSAATAFTALKQDATTSATGVVEIATTAETISGTDTTRATTPAAIAARQLYTGIPPPDYWISDGTTTSRGQVATPGTIGALAGLRAITIDVDQFTVPASAPSAAVYLAGWAPVATSAPAGQAWSLSVYLATSGKIVVHATGATPATDYRIYTSDASIVTGAAHTVRLVVVITGGSATAPVLYLTPTDANGIPSTCIVPATAADGSGTDPNWLDASLDSTVAVFAYAAPAGSIPIVRPIVDILTASEAAIRVSGGRLPDRSMYAGDTRANVTTGRAYSVGTTDANDATGATSIGWTIAAAAGTRTSGTGSYYIAATAPIGGSGRYIDIALARTIPAGSRITASIWTYDTINSADFSFRNAGGQTLYSPATTGNSGWVHHTFSATLATDMTTIRLLKSGGNAGNTDFRIDDVEIDVLGLLDDPIPQPGYATGDRLKRASRRNIGIDAVTMRRDVRLHQSLTWSGTHEPKSLLGGQCVPSGFVPTLITLKPSVASSGTGWTVGTSADPARYKSAATYSTSKVVYTLSDFANRVPGGTSASNLDIVVDPDSANYSGTIDVTIDGIVSAGTP